MGLAGSGRLFHRPRAESLIAGSGRAVGVVSTRELHGLCALCPSRLGQTASWLYLSMTARVCAQPQSTPELGSSWNPVGRALDAVFHDSAPVLVRPGLLERSLDAQHMTDDDFTRLSIGRWKSWPGNRGAGAPRHWDCSVCIPQGAAAVSHLTPALVTRPRRQWASFGRSMSSASARRSAFHAPAGGMRAAERSRPS